MKEVAQRGLTWQTLVTRLAIGAAILILVVAGGHLLTSWMLAQFVCGWGKVESLDTGNLWPPEISMKIECAP
jgi:hypothetical protein